MIRFLALLGRDRFSLTDGIYLMICGGFLSAEYYWSAAGTYVVGLAISIALYGVAKQYDGRSRK